MNNFESYDKKIKIPADILKNSFPFLVYQDAFSCYYLDINEVDVSSNLKFINVEVIDRLYYFHHKESPFYENVNECAIVGRMRDKNKNMMLYFYMHGAIWNLGHDYEGYVYMARDPNLLLQEIYIENEIRYTVYKNLKLDKIDIKKQNPYPEDIHYRYRSNCRGIIYPEEFQSVINNIDFNIPFDNIYIPIEWNNDNDPAQFKFDIKNIDRVYYLMMDRDKINMYARLDPRLFVYINIDKTKKKSNNIFFSKFRDVYINAIIKMIPDLEIKKSIEDTIRKDTILV